MIKLGIVCIGGAKLGLMIVCLVAVITVSLLLRFRQKVGGDA